MNFPVGAIIMWYKAINLRTAGWELCDGTNGTPDLREKFIKGASADGDRGAVGAATHVHTNSSAVAGNDHNHSIPVTLSGLADGNYTQAGGAYTAAGPNHQHVYTGGSSDSGTHAHTTSNTNSGDSLPTFVQVFFIMKVT